MWCASTLDKCFTIPLVFLVPPVYYSSCSFDDDTCGWNQMRVVDYFDWIRINGSTPSFTTGPKSDHTQNDGEFNLLTLLIINK